MTPLTASGWLWLGWCVFITAGTLIDMFRNVKFEDKVVLALISLLSLAWLGWLVSP